MKNISTKCLIAIILFGLLATMGCNVKMGDIIQFGRSLYKVIPREIIGRTNGTGGTVAKVIFKSVGIPLNSPPTLNTLQTKVMIEDARSEAIIIPQPLTPIGRVSYAGTFSEATNIGKRFRIPIATNGDSISVFPGRDLPEGWTVEIKPSGSYLEKELKEGERPMWPANTSFFTVTIRGTGGVLSGTAFELTSSGTTQLEWCQIAIKGTDCSSVLNIWEREALLQGNFMLVEEGSLWSMDFWLHIPENEAADSVVIRWSSTDAQLFAVEPSREVFFATLVTESSDIDGNIILLENAGLEWVANATISAPGKNSSLEPVIENDLAVWRTGGQTLALPREIWETKKISTTSPGINPEKKLLISWGHVKKGF